MVQNDWPTQTQDLQIADEIMNRHQELNEDEPLGFLEFVVSENKKKAIEVRLPDWILELIQHYRNQYGYEYGQAIASKVITRLLLKDEVIH